MPMKKRITKKRITAGMLAAMLALMESFVPLPNAAEGFRPGSIHAYALETEVSSADVGTGSEANPTTGTEAFNAALGGIRKYFMKLGARAFQTVTPGESLPEKTTFVSFDTADGFYYLVRQRTEPAVDPEKPDTAAQALDRGWIKKTGSGTYVWQNLSWNRTYDVYELDASGTPTEMRKLGSAATVIGKAGGTVTLEGELLTGNKVNAVVENPSTEDGNWSWYTAASADAAVWTPCTEGAAGNELTIPPTVGGLYLKAVFTPTAGGDFEGTIESVSGQPAASLVTGVSIAGAAKIGETLTASVTPTACAPGVRYEWYRTVSGVAESTGGQFLYAGSTYEIQAEDIGSRLYVRAVSLPSSVSSGEAVSALTENVISVPYTAPAAPEIKKTGATALTVSMQSGTDTAGLYEFGYSTQANPDKTGTEFHTATTKARGTGEVTIPELASSTVYYIWARRAGESGFTDSPWSTAPISGTTLPPALAGSLSLTGTCSYGETLTAALSVSGQNGSFHWYRDGMELTEAGNPSHGAGSSSYLPGSDDIGKQLTVIYKGGTAGGGTPSSGELTAVSDVVEKKTAAVPVYSLADSDVAKTDSSLTFAIPTIPAGGAKKLKVGYALSSTGVPSGLSGALNQGNTVEIPGLDRNTDYYIFFKYVETETEKESSWSAASGPFRTRKRSLSGDTITFDLASPHPGERLTAILTSTKDLGAIDGTWIWTENVGGISTPVAFVADTETPERTSYLIPAGAVTGTTYTVKFTGRNDMDGDVTGTSQGVTPASQEQYPTPAAPFIAAVSDASLTVGMQDGAEGIYQFSYGLTGAGAESDWTTVDNTVYGSNTVTITGLVRNTDYYVRARRLTSESSHRDSDWSHSTRRKTGLTELGGSVSISGNAENGSLLTAAYAGASYLPAGNDTGGSYRWQKALNAVNIAVNGVVEDPVYTDIPGAITNLYRLTSADVNYRLKVIYTASGADGFAGEKSAETDVVKKTVQAAPPAAVMEAGSLETDKIMIRAKGLSTSGFYQIRMRNAEVPKAPELEANAAGLGWKKPTAGEMDVHTYYDPAAKAEAELSPGTEYIIYTVYAGTADLQPSQVVAGTSLTAGYYQQTGSITYASGQDTAGGVIVSGGELKAELTGGNAAAGSWKWYVSTTLYSEAAPGSGGWVYLPSGYYPVTNSTVSTLTLTDDMVGKYVRAEFVADSSGGCTGTVGETAGGQSYYSQHVKKIYKETLKIESSSTNGFGEPMAYAGSTLTVTVENYAESGDLNSNRTTVELLSNNVVMTGLTFNYNENKFTCTLPRNNTLAGQTITARVSKPRDLNLYVTEALGTVDGTALSSDTSTSTSLVYKDGIPISTAGQLEALMAAGSADGQSYAARNETYVLTENIEMGTSRKTVQKTIFNGVLDGEYHTITNIQNELFYATGNATIQNIIFNRANVDTSGDPNSNENSASIIARRVDNGKTVLRRLFMSQATIKSVWDGAYLIGKTISSDGSSVVVEECGSAGGSISIPNDQRSAAGLVGFIDASSSQRSTGTITDVFSYNTQITGDGNGNIGGITNGRGNITVKNAVAASKISGQNRSTSGGVIGVFNTSMVRLTSTNCYYDSILTPSSSFIENSQRGVAKETNELIGDQLQTQFGSEKWSYSPGFYPRLSWLKDDPIAILFAATRGSFTSVVIGETSEADMFKGDISGPIEVPAEMQTEYHSYETTGDLSVDEAGMITPTGTGGGTVTIKYDDGLYSAQNTYQFNTSKVPAIRKNFQSVTLSPVTNVQVGTVLTAAAQLAAGDAAASAAVTYQWYKRANGSAEKIIIPGKTGNTYTVEPTDVGYSFMATASANGYWDSGTSFTNTIELTAPSSPPSVRVDDYQTVTVTGQGGALSNYEFAYARTAAGEKTVIGYDQYHPVTQTITGLEAYTGYWFFSRVAAGSGYSASPWSAGVNITTLRIPLEGTVALNGSKNVGNVLTAAIEDTNLQTGSWKVERIDGGSATELTTADNVYEVSYTLKTEDVGKTIRFTFTANGKFTGTAQASSPVIEKSVHTAPTTPPVFKQKTDTTITLEPYSGTVSGDLALYQYGCQAGSGTIVELTGTVEEVTQPSAEAGIRISGLSRNTSYSFYVRRKEDAGNLSGNWSPALTVTTDKTNISGKGPLVFTIGDRTEAQAVPTVEDIITAAAPAGITGLTGSWSLEKTLSGQKASLSGYTVADGGLSISYTLGALDAGYTIQAVFRGSGDFTGEIVTPMIAETKKRQYPTPANGSFTIVGQTDSTIVVKLGSGLNGSYQFGKSLAGSGEAEPCVGSLRQGDSYTISGLGRNKTYDVQVRRIEETGYSTSGWSAAVSGTTDKTEINGDIQISGTVEIGETLTAEYHGGSYSQNGLADDKGGSYTWKADDTVVGTGTGASSTYAIKDGDQVKSIRVIYTPPAGSDFKGSRTKLAGTVAKAAAVPPAEPSLSPQANNSAGSVLRITNAESGAWYIPVKYTGNADTGPEPVPESGAAAAGWVKATGTTLDFTGLAANTDYLVYGARLETETSVASLLIVSEKTRTLKEEIAKGTSGSGSTGITGPAVLKPMDGDGTKVSIAVYGKAPTGIWNWYAAKQADGSDGWKIIRSEKHEEAAGAVEASDTYQIPYEYSGYYLKVEFQADGGYTGLESWKPAGPVADREITGTVTVTPEGGSGNERLFEKISAAYGGTDDKNGTWAWYREDSGAPGGWKAISPELYTAAGPESVYTPTGEDKGKKLKAVYTAASFGSTGSREAETEAVSAAIQTTPAAPKIVLISGTNITLADSSPELAGPYGGRPEAVFGYRKTSEAESSVTWLDSGNQASGLTPSTGYVFYTKYKATEVYSESQASPATIEIATGSGILYQTNLSLSYDTSDGESKKMDVGRTVTAVYQGEGWDKGEFTMRRSDGQAVTGFTQTVDDVNRKVTCAYELPLNMAGFRLTFLYTAKAESDYSGSVELLTGAVKKAAGDIPSAPILEKHLDTDLYLTNVTNGQEYAILKEKDGGGAPEEPARYSSLWQILTAGETGKYRYTGLERGTAYYVFTRTVETAQREVSAAVISNMVTTESFLYMGDLTLKNERDLHTQPVAVTAPMEIPTTLNGNLTVESIRVAKAGDGGTAPFSATESLSEFVTGEDGGTRSLNPNVYEKGSSWANSHFATTLRLSDSGGQYTELENGGRSIFTGGDTMALSVYRANAVTVGGSYIWEIALRDDDGTEALLKAGVTIVTQLEATVPLQMALQIRDQELLQTTNGASLKNGNGMPVEVSVNEKPGKGTNMPELSGEPANSDTKLMDPGAVYMKMSVDNSMETGRVTDLWFNTTLTADSIKPLVKLGASSQADYYISGLISENGTVDWPWPSDGSQTIREAYQLKFIYEISAEGYPVYTPDISSPDAITVPQEGGES